MNEMSRKFRRILPGQLAEIAETLFEFAGHQE